ncbi:hypothetical protein [Komagataeibacter xylinus]|nr:hypothetical protein [Komagataeibacter xylinus]
MKIFECRLFSKKWRSLKLLEKSFPKNFFNLRNALLAGKPTAL